MTAGTARKTPLYDRHVQAGGRLVEFAGFELPVQYEGVIAESQIVRNDAGMFDVSHMARLWLKGDKVQEFVEHVSANDASKLADGRGQYSLMPNANGGTVDDIIVYRVNETCFRMVINAANHEKDVAWLHSQNSFGVEIEDETERTTMIAVQGPNACGKIMSICDNPSALESAPLFGLNELKIGGVDCFAPRSGYTGEDGFELICANSDAEKLWDALIGVGVKPCGLGSRDVLRVEAGLPLYGHELNDELSPIAAGLGWVISKTKNFVGSDFINLARVNGTPTKLQGIQLESKRVASPGMEVFIDGNVVGVVSSGVYSPTLECGIAFAFLNPEIKLETPCSIEIRGKHEPGIVVSKRFVKRA